MTYLLDTVVWLWSLDAIDRINKRGLEILHSGEEKIYLSAATAWEVSIKAGLGKLRLPAPPRACVLSFAEKQALRSLPITQLHAVKVYDLPPHHNDPFDRLIIAQAMVENFTVLTSDRVFGKYPVEVVWCGK
jgi:PIN domain nuclease of toxin-antitoxin system